MVHWTHVRQVINSYFFFDILQHHAQAPFFIYKKLVDEEHTARTPKITKLLELQKELLFVEKELFCLLFLEF